MSDARRTDNDPSMDDILASIRKIISEDEARAKVGDGAGGASTLPSPTPGVMPPRPLTATRRDDVLLLTELIEEPKAIPAPAPILRAVPSAPPPQAVAPASAPIPMPAPVPRIDPVKAAEMPQPSIEPAIDQSLIGSSVAGATASALERLSQAMQDSAPQPEPAEKGPVVGGGGKTIEDLVKEMLRPMLKDWLDQNLPPMVERFVEREIVRLTRR